jgi:hypothetical protein
VERIAVRAPLVSLCLVAALGGCGTAPTRSTSPSDQITVVHPEDAVTSVLGTPFYLAFKSMTCAVGVAIAAPVAGIAALSESYFAPAIQRGLGDGINQNCGPPYVLSPYREVTVKPTENIPETPAPAPRPERPSGLPDVPAPSRSLGPAPARPEISPPAQPPKSSPDHSAALMIEEVSEPAAGGPIKLFNK